MSRTVTDRELYHRVLKATPETISIQFEENGAADDPGTTTIGITNEAGTEVVAAGTATTGSTTAPRTYALTKTHTASLDRLTVAWTPTNYGAQVTYVEIVGAHLFSVSEARAFDNSAMSNTTSYPTLDIEETRGRITDEFERITGVSFIPRYDRATLSGTGSAELAVHTSVSPRHPALYLSSIRNVETLSESTMTWTAFTAGELAEVQILPGGVIRRAGGDAFTAGRGNVRVTYEYGVTVAPLAIKRAALTLCRYLLVPSNLNSRALQESSQFGSIQLATAGRYGDHYGIPAVDSVLDRYAERVPVIG